MRTRVSSSYPLTVVMSVYNGSRFLDEAIDSIRTQSFRNFEFLIVDDGSTDDSPRILARHAAVDDRIRILAQENRGLIEALNRGFKEATGAYIARMDADDVSRRCRLEMEMDFMSSNPEIAVVGGVIEVIDAEARCFGAIRLPTRPEEIRKHMRELGCALAHPTVLFRRDAMLQMGGFRKAYKHAEDYDLWLRMLERFDFVNLEDVVLDYRRHNTSISYQNATQQILSAWCARIVAKRRLAGLQDPTREAELITPAVLRELGVAHEEIDEQIFLGLVAMAEDSLRYGLCSFAGEFPRMARPHASEERLREASLELNRKAAIARTIPEEKVKHRQTLLEAAPQIYREVFAPASLRRRLVSKVLAPRGPSKGTGLYT